MVVGEGKEDKDGSLGWFWSGDLGFWWTGMDLAVAPFFRSVRLVILFGSCWVLLGFVLWVMLFRSWDRESWSWFWVVMLFGSWDRESCSCWEWMGELRFINERVRDDNLFFLFFGVLVMGLSSCMLGLIWEEQAVKWRTSWRTWRNFLISVSFFTFFFSFVLL